MQWNSRKNSWKNSRNDYCILKIYSSKLHKLFLNLQCAMELQKRFMNFLSLYYVELREILLEFKCIVSLLPHNSNSENPKRNVATVLIGVTDSAIWIGKKKLVFAFGKSVHVCLLLKNGIWNCSIELKYC